MKKCVFTGVATALVTPFNQDLSINFGMFERLMDFQIKGGVDALVICGTTGESATLNDDEKLLLFKSAVKFANGKLPIIAGTGSNSTSKVINLSKRAEDCGVDALLIVTPYYNKTSQLGLIKHYYAIADSISIPIIVYNVPTRTGMDIKPATYKELLKHERIVAIKEASSNIVNLTETFAICDEPCIYSGADELILPMLSLGANGVISVVSNILPEAVSKLCRCFFNGDLDTARKSQLELMPIINAIFSDVNPMPIKHALNCLNFDVGIARPPLCDINTELKKQLEKILIKK